MIRLMIRLMIKDEFTKIPKIPGNSRDTALNYIG